jgi:hypothetical protein
VAGFVAFSTLGLAFFIVTGLWLGTWNGYWYPPIMPGILLWEAISETPPEENLISIVVLSSLAAGGFGAFLGWLWHRDRARRDPARDQCAECGYCLIGNVSGVCPECGKKT